MAERVFDGGQIAAGVVGVGGGRLAVAVVDVVGRVGVPGGAAAEEAVGVIGEGGRRRRDAAGCQAVFGRCLGGACHGGKRIFDLLAEWEGHRLGAVAVIRD